MLVDTNNQTSHINPAAFFRSVVPNALVGDLARIIDASRQAAWAASAGFDPGIRHDLFPHLRRANVEAALLGLGRRYAKLGVTTSEEANETGNSHHTVVRVGSVVITASAVETSDTLVREARFRRSLAKNPQLALGIVEAEEDPPSDALYALLLYPNGALPEDATGDLGFVVVRFPASDCSTYVGDSIDALAESRGHDRRSGASPRRRRIDEAG